MPPESAPLYTSEMHAEWMEPMTNHLIGKGHSVQHIQDMTVLARSMLDCKLFIQRHAHQLPVANDDEYVKACYVKICPLNQIIHMRNCAPLLGNLDLLQHTLSKGERHLGYDIKVLNVEDLNYIRLFFIPHDWCVARNTQIDSTNGSVRASYNIADYHTYFVREPRAAWDLFMTSKLPIEQPHGKLRKLIRNPVTVLKTSCAPDYVI